MAMRLLRLMARNLSERERLLLHCCCSFGRLTSAECPRTGFINPRGRAGPSGEARQTRGAWRTRRRVRERRATPRADADRPSPLRADRLRRQRAICSVAPPRSTTEGTPSSSLLASGPLALATRFARIYEAGSRYAHTSLSAFEGSFDSHRSARVYHHPGTELLVWAHPPGTPGDAPAPQRHRKGSLETDGNP